MIPAETTTCRGCRVARWRHSRRRQDAWWGPHRRRQHMACRIKDLLRACAGDGGINYISLTSSAVAHMGARRLPCCGHISCKRCRTTERTSHHSPCREGVLREEGAFQVGALLVGVGPLEGALAEVAAVAQTC